MDIEQLKYPIGKLVDTGDYGEENIQKWIKELKALPAEFTSVAERLTDEQLETPYRPEGWTGRQVIHHVADSHMNALIRVKLCLTEDNPAVKPYSESDWANLPDYKLAVNKSLVMISLVHEHLVTILENCSAEDFRRLFTHPQYKYTRPLAYLCALYAWHGRHHTGHLKIISGS